jgi:hypothetical protein
MCRFALHGQGQNCHVAARWRAMACRGSLLALPQRARLGCRPTALCVSPSPGRGDGFLPTLGDRVCTRGEIR